jgi:hypothetical protein
MRILVLVTAVLVSQLALAHGDHAPKVANCKGECTKADIEKAVPVAVMALVADGNVDQSWNAAKVDKVELREFKKSSEWVATLVDEKVKDKAKQKLYIFMTKTGTLSGANHTGQ